VIQEIWDKAVAQAKAAGGDSAAVYVTLLEAKIETTTILKKAALKKVADMLMACKASTFFVDEADPSNELYRNLHKLVISILSTPEQAVAAEITKQQFAVKTMRMRLGALLKSNGFDGAHVMTDQEVVDAFEKLLVGRKAVDNENAKESA